MLRQLQDQLKPNKIDFDIDFDLMSCENFWSVAHLNFCSVNRPPELWSNMHITEY